MNLPDTAVPYWFLWGFFTLILFVLGQVFVKWIGFKFFTKEDKWIGTERRRSIEVDEHFLTEFLDTYKKHVDFVELLVKNSKEFAQQFEDHDLKESKNQKLIKELHQKLIAET